MGPPSDDSDYKRQDRLSEETVHALRASLTVIKLQAQMVGRWLQREHVAGTQVAATRLTVIDSMVERLVDQLKSFDEPPPQGEQGTSRNGRSGR